MNNIEVEELISMPKQFVGLEVMDLPSKGSKKLFNLVEIGGTTKFNLFIHRGQIKTKVIFHHTRGTSDGLFRLCINGARHFCDDIGTKTTCHMHYYREGYDLKKAKSLDPSLHEIKDDAVLVCKWVLKFLNIRDIEIQDSLL